MPLPMILSLATHHSYHKLPKGCARSQSTRIYSTPIACQDPCYVLEGMKLSGNQQASEEGLKQAFQSEGAGQERMGPGRPLYCFTVDL